MIDHVGKKIVPFSDLTAANHVLKIMPHMILLDEWLGANRGSDFCTQIKINHLTAGIPVILISTVSNVEAFAKNCKADAFLLILML